MEQLLIKQQGLVWYQVGGRFKSFTFIICGSALADFFEMYISKTSLVVGKVD